MRHRPSATPRRGSACRRPTASTPAAHRAPTISRPRPAPHSPPITRRAASPTWRWRSRSASRASYGLGNVSATLGARVAEPLIANGFTPAIDDRRYAGAGPRLGLQGNAPVNSAWNVEWQVGASMLFNNGSLPGGAPANSVTQYSGSQTGSVRQRRRPARPHPLVRRGIQADLGLSRRRVSEQFAAAQSRRRAAAAAEPGPHRSRSDGPLHDPEVTCSAVIPGRA